MSKLQEIIDYIVEVVEADGGVTVHFNDAAEDEMSLVIGELIWEYDFVVTKTEDGIVVERKTQ